LNPGPQGYEDNEYYTSIYFTISYKYCCSRYVSLSKLKEAQKGSAHFSWNMLELPDNWKEVKRIKNCKLWKLSTNLENILSTLF
jgi:hypothetical protein